LRVAPLNKGVRRYVAGSVELAVISITKKSGPTSCEWQSAETSNSRA
jgi:hypothetical protein